MNKIALILLVATLSSCGLFKKVSTTKESEQFTVVSDSVSKQKTVESKSTQETTDYKESVITQIEADQITIYPDGSIDAKGGAKVKQSALNEASTNKIEVSSKTETKETKDATKIKQKTSVKQKTATPHKSIIDVIMIFIIAAVLIVVIKKRFF